MVVKERDVFERSVAFASLEYKVIEKNMGDYQRLYRFVVLENVGDVYQLAELMGNRLISEVSQMKRVLLGYLKVLFGGSVDLGVVAESVCPSCFCSGLVDSSGGDGIRKVCSCCGLELGDEYGSFRDFSQNLDFDVTLAPVSPLSSSPAGNTFNPNARRTCPDHQNFLYKTVNGCNVLFSAFAKANPDVAALLGEDGFEVVKDGFVFCRMGDFVRRCSVEEFAEAKMGFWREFDSFLRESAIRGNVKVKDIVDCVGVDNRVNVLFKKGDEADGKVKDCFELYPEIADKLVTEGFEVEYKGLVFCRVGNFVRRCSVEEFAKVKLKIWHGFDAMLRKSILEKNITLKGLLSREKEYVFSLCKRYGFDSEVTCNPQDFYKYVATSLVEFKPLLALLNKRVSCEVFVETVFYMCAAEFNGSKGYNLRRIADDLLIANPQHDLLYSFFTGVKKLVSSLDKTSDCID